MVSVFLLVLPALFVFQIQEGKTWSERLILPDLEQTIPRHTPRFTEGMYLPPQIIGTKIITKDQSPVLLSTTTTITPGAMLTIEPGTTIYASEFASLIVEGKLVADQVIFTTNELHPLNQLWNGLIVKQGGQMTIKNASIEYASPGISCLMNSSVTISKTKITHTATDIFNEGTTCHVQ